MPELVLIRGVPGTHKNLLAKTRYPDHVLCKADQYFERNGKYKYDRSKVRASHHWCREKTRMALARGEDVVVVNTFVQAWEIRPYLQMCQNVKIIEATGEHESGRGVAKETIERMRRDFEKIDA